MLSDSKNDQRIIFLNTVFSRYGNFRMGVIHPHSVLREGQLCRFSAELDVGTRGVQRQVIGDILKNPEIFANGFHEEVVRTFTRNSKAVVAIRSAFIGAADMAFGLTTDKKLLTAISLNGHPTFTADLRR